ncbi:MAG: nucleoid-associated protein [Eubacteriales bacterium]|nr:nucleoid-associated protein [Eubacteriales bacterium]
MNEIIIEKSILHILDTSIGTHILSDRVLPADESTDFFSRHIEKLLGDSELKECRFEEGDNPVRALIESISDESFVPSTHQLAAKLYGIMASNPEIPSADVIFAVFRYQNDRFLGIVKFNYKEAYTHSLSSMEGITAASVIKHKALFANDSQKVDECIFINLNSLDIKIKEKKYEINGQKDHYLSSLYMRTRPARSYKEQFRLIEKSAEQVLKKYYAGDSLKTAEVKTAIKNNVDRNLEIDIDDLSKAAFHDSPDMQAQYKQELSQKGFTEKKIKINQQIYNELERNHKIITDIGIKMEIPSDLMKDKNKVEFFVNQDGTMSILVKNINEVKSR